MGWLGRLRDEIEKLKELDQIGIGVVFETLADGLGKLLKVGVNAVVNLVKVNKALSAANECLKNLVVEINDRDGNGELVLEAIKDELTQNGFFKKSGLSKLFRRDKVSAGDFCNEFLNSIDFDVDRIMELDCVKKLTDSEKEQVKLAFAHLHHAFVEYYNEMLPKNDKMLVSVLRYHFESFLGEKMEELRERLDNFLVANTSEVDICPNCGRATPKEFLEKLCVVECNCGTSYDSRVMKDVNTDLIKTITDGLDDKLNSISVEISKLEASLGKKIDAAKTEVIAIVSEASDDGKRHTSQETDRAVEEIKAHSTACVKELGEKVEVAVSRPTTTNTNNGTVYNLNGTGSTIAADTFAILFTETKAKLEATKAALSAEIAAHDEDKRALESALDEIEALKSLHAEELYNLRKAHSVELRHIRSEHEVAISEKDKEIAILNGKIDGLQVDNAHLIDTYKKRNYPIPTRLEVGSTVKFGRYPQSGERDDKGELITKLIEWLVLDVKDGKALLISKYALDNKRFNKDHSTNEWSECTLREWLNSPQGFFRDEYFSGGHKGDIYPSGIEGVEEDKVFLLSTKEAREYFASYEERVCRSTAYAHKNGVYSGTCWWLRDGYNQYSAANVSYDGLVNVSYVDYDKVYVRPALWVNRDSLFFET